MTDMTARNEDPKELAVVGANAPAWLTEASQDDVSLAGTAEYRVVGRLKLLQPLTSQDLKDRFGEGSAILFPNETLIASKGETFSFVPLFFFVEYTEQTDLNDKATDFIVDRSFDRDSELARKAKNKSTRSQSYGDENEFTRKFVEHLCFVGVIYGEHEAQGQPLCMSFDKGEFGKGQSFISAVRSRRVPGPGDEPIIPPLWSQVWNFTPAFRDRGEARRWWGLDFSNPEHGNLYIAQGEAPGFKELHNELRTLHQEKRLEVNRSDEGVKIDPEQVAEAEIGGGEAVNL